MKANFANSPCFNCKDRWVSDSGRCHDVCDRYKEYNSRLRHIKDCMAKSKKIDDDARNVTLNSIRRNSRCKLTSSGNFGTC